jgi:hypothetical protein
MHATTEEETGKNETNKLRKSHHSFDLKRIDSGTG